jgi:hypothetical protein
MITKGGPVGFVGVGLHPTPGLRVVKRLVGLPNAKGNGIERSVQNGIRKTLIILKPIIFKRNLMLPPHLRAPHRSCR